MAIMASYRSDYSVRAGVDDFSANWPLYIVQFHKGNACIHDSSCSGMLQDLPFKLPFVRENALELVILKSKTGENLLHLFTLSGISIPVGRQIDALCFM